MSKMMVNVKSKVKQSLNDRLEAMNVKHSELEEDQNNKLTRLHTYKKFATLHYEMNHHSYTS
jgi:chaperonin cofactor prefoldin